MNIAIDFVGQFGPKYSVFYADDSGKPLQPLFTPHQKQIEFFDSVGRFPYVLFGGGRGGGKTAAIIWLAVFTAYLLPGSRIIIFRRTMGELKKTIIDGFLNLPKGLYLKCTEDSVTFENGSKVWFGSADDEKAVRKLLSGEYDLMIFDEWSEWPLSMWKFAAGSCRSTRSADIFGRPYAPTVTGGTNPGGVGGESLAAMFGCHPGKPKRQAPGEDPSLYDPTEYKFIQSLVSDNPAYAETTAAGKAYRKMLNSQPRRIRAAWLEGRWDGFEGQYFDVLDESVTKLCHDDFLRLIKKQHWAPRWISIDWGMTHHASVGWHALLQIGGKDLPVTYRSYLTRGLGESALAEEICDYTENGGDKGKIVKVYLSPDTFGETNQSRARRIGDVFVQRGLPRPVAANNKREDGWRLMHDLLRQRWDVAGLHEWSDGEWRSCDTRQVSGWLITDHRTEPIPKDGDLPHPLECLTQAICDPKKDGDVVREGDAVYLDVNDQLRYGIASHISPIAKPFDERVKEELAEIPMEGTQRFITHMKLQQKEREQNHGVFYVGRGRRR